jgi:hypothetical protein
MSLPENSARVMKKRKKGNSRRGVPFSRGYARALTTKALISKQLLTEKRDINSLNDDPQFSQPPVNSVRKST